jgi:hypothetical protein
MEFMKIVGREGVLLQAVRKLGKTAGHNVLTQVKTRTYEERLRVLNRESAMFFTHDVVDLTAKERVVLVHQTIFAEPLSPDNHESPQFGRDISQAHGVRRWRARAFANRIKCSNWR